MTLFAKIGSALLAGADKDTDLYGADRPTTFFVIASESSSLLGRLRDFQEAIDGVKGDARRAGGDQITWFVNEDDTMVTTSQTATQFNH
jgi:hypothetical protein